MATIAEIHGPNPSSAAGNPLLAGLEDDAGEPV